MTGRQRRLAVGGLVGPGAFVLAWSLSGASTMGYSPVHEAISDLAAVGSQTWLPMTAGFVAFGIAVPLYAIALRAGLSGRSWVAASVAGLATLAVAATPLGSSGSDAAHGVAATVGYLSLTLTLTPALAVVPFRAMGEHGWARYSLLSALVGGGCLVLTATDASHGLFQRAGLAAGDLWIAATAWTMVRAGGWGEARSGLRGVGGASPR